MAMTQDNTQVTTFQVAPDDGKPYPIEFLEAVLDHAQHHMYVWLEANAPKEIRELYDMAENLSWAIHGGTSQQITDALRELAWALHGADVGFHGAGNLFPIRTEKP